jgi:hypothetical protein
LTARQFYPETAKATDWPPFELNILSPEFALILPDRNKETVTAGHCLHPRYMGCLDDNADEIAAALCRILTRERDGQMKLHLKD